MVTRRFDARSWCYLAILSAYALFAAGYVYLRFAWRWLDGDAASLTWASQSVFQAGELTPATGAYQIGYAYPALNVFLSHLTGISIASLQGFVQPFLTALLVPVAVVAFRALTGSQAVGLLGGLLLFVQPEFLFETVRGSHARLTWTLALGMLFALARSFGAAHSARAVARWVLLFYACCFSLIASNSFFAFSYVVGIAFAFLGGWILLRWWRQGHEIAAGLGRLLYVILSCAVLMFLFYFYIYPPALVQVRVLESIVNQVAAFFLDVDVGTNPYAYVQATWLSRELYLALTLLNWLLLLVSFAAWSRKAWTLARRRGKLTGPALLLWLLYAAFASLMALSLILDWAGVLSANLQVRMFPHFMVFAIPLAGEALVDALRWAGRQDVAVRAALAAALALGVAYFALAALLKVTNEPLLSSQWQFHLPGERLALEWGGTYLREAQVWAGFDRRLAGSPAFHEAWRSNGVVATWGRPDLQSDYYLLSEVTAMYARRRRVPLPDTRPQLQLYDSGSATLFKRRPSTPFQR
jgi:hypothetical protein